MPNKWLRVLLIAIGALLVLCICLGAGIFAVRLNNRGVGRPVGLFRRTFSLNSRHGAIGTIQGFDNQTITLILRDGTTQTVLVNNETRIEENRKRITITDVKANDQITVIGSPDSQGQIVARWIHVVRAPSPTPTLLRATPTSVQ
jgi:hypothetical protein